MAAVELWESPYCSSLMAFAARGTLNSYYVGRLTETMMTKSRMTLKIACMLLVAWVGFSGSASAQIQYAPTIIKVGKWLGGQFLAYTTGKAFDKILGYDNEQQLMTVQAGLEAQIRKNSGDAQKVQQMRVELETTNSQLAMLRAMMTSKPSTKEMESFRLKLASDLEKLANIQRQHAEQLRRHETRIDQHDARFEKVEGDVADVMERLRRLEGGVDISSYSRDLGGEPSVDWREEKPQERSPRSHTQRRGVTLTVAVSGNSNELRVQEVASPEQANVGSFEVKGRRDQHVFFLLAGTGSVINLSGTANRVTLPRLLCGRVRVVNRGERNSIVGCS